MDSTYSIKNLITLFLRKIWIIIAVTLCGGIAAFCVSKFVIPLEYSSHISMYVQSYTGISNESNGNYNDISKSKQLINTYIEVLKDDAVMESVGNSLTKQFDEKIILENFSVSDGKIKPSSLASAITISAVIDTSAINIVAITKNAELSAAVCNELCRQANQFTTKAIGVGEIKSINTAKVYNTPVAPNMMKNTIIGGLAALMLSVLMILMIDFFDNTIKESNEVSKKHQLAVLGEIQEIGVKKSRKNDREHYLITDKTVPFNITESYKAMRTNLIFSLSTSDKKIAAISSALPGDGKSTIAANLAIAFSQLNENKVLLIDVDMRKPVQHKLFHVKNSAGIAEYLGKMKQKEECVQKSDVPNLDIITSGSLPPNPSELLASEQMKKLLSEVSEEYDYIILDMPPVNVVSDPLTIGGNISGMVVVTHYGKTTHDDLEELMRKVENSDTKLLGFVLNEIKSKQSGKYGYSRKYKYYSYSELTKKEENQEKNHAE